MSIFSIVRFANSQCFGTNGYNGTCLTSAECSQNGGTAAGSCAAGFGVCCTGAIKYFITHKDLQLYQKLCFTVIVTRCGSAVTLNNTYWQNSGYSTTTTTAGQCSITVKECSTNICQFRYFTNPRIYCISQFYRMVTLGWTTSTL